PSLGATGAAIGTVAAEFTVLIAQLYYLKNELIQMLSGVQYLKIEASLVVALLALGLLKKTISIDDLFLDLCDSAFIYFGVYFILLIIEKERLVYQYYKQYKEKIIKLIKKK